jgi:hypothetical protein
MMNIGAYITHTMAQVAGDLTWKLAAQMVEHLMGAEVDGPEWGLRRSDAVT